MHCLRLSLVRIFLMILFLSLPWLNHVQADVDLNDTNMKRVNGQTSLHQTDVIQIKAQWSANGIKPGEPVTLALIFDIAEDGHLNSNDPGEPDLIPTRVSPANHHASIKLNNPVFPQSKVYSIGSGEDALHINSYEDRAVVLIPVELVDDIEPGIHQITLDVQYQACDGPECLAPEFPTLQIPLQVLHADTVQIATVSENFAGQNFVDLVKLGSDQNSNQAVKSDAFDFFGYQFNVGGGMFGVGLILLLGFTAGALLNVMPCVLPVLPMKVMSLRKHAEHPTKAFMLGLVFSMGIISCFAVLGLLAAGLVSGMDQLQWGQQFSNWWFTAGLGAIMLVMGLGLMGLFTIQLPQKIYFLQPSADSYAGSFGFGVLTAVLSTPCTGPLFAGTLAWALKQPAWLSLSAFVLMGVGMALPYQLLTLKPSLMDKLPKSGPAGGMIKDAMGISMLAVAMYFFGVAGQGIWSDWYWYAIAATLIGGLGYLSVCAWIKTDARKLQLSMTIATLVVAPVVLFAANKLKSDTLIQWETYDQTTFMQARGDGKITVVEFTAEWCANCKVIESTVFSNPDIADRLNASDIKPIKVDLTSSNNKEGWDKLEELGARGIPLTAVYLPGEEEPRLLSSLYASEDLMALIEKQ